MTAPPAMRPRPWLALGGLLVLLLPACWPYLAGDLPRTNDTEALVFRAYALLQSLRAGDWLPRWAPQLVHGYGYPVFHYFPNLTFYLLAGVHLISGSSLLAAYRVVMCAALVAAAMGAWQLGRKLWGRDSAGLLAAAAYSYSPYILYTAHVRGGLPEVLALAALPWTLERWIAAASGSRRALLGGGALYAAMILSHGGAALQASVPLALGAVWLGRSAGLWRTLRSVAQCALLGLLLAAFQWLPALLEIGYAQVQQGYGATNIRYDLNFIGFADLFTYPRLPLNSDLLNPPVLRPLGVVALAAALAALLVRRKQAVAWGLAALAGLCVYLALAQSRWVWDALPLLQRTLWPWRLLGPAALLLALLAAGLDSSSVGIRRWLAPVLLLAITGSALPFLFPPRASLTAPGSSAQLANSELPPLLIGTTTTAEYLPRWVTALPDGSAQRLALQTSADPDRLERAALPPDASAVHASNGWLRDEYELQAAAPFELRFRQFYFPGWRAALDGQPLQVRVTAPHGLIAVTVPAGNHRLVLQFGATPVRAAADALSAAAWLWWLFQVSAGLLVGAARTHNPDAVRPAGGLRRSAAAAGLFAVCFGVLLNVDSPVRRPGLAAGSQPAGMQHALQADLSGELLLHGYALRGLQLDLYWQAQRRLGVNYNFNVRLLDAAGMLWNRVEIVRPADWRFIPGTDFWPPEKYIVDSQILQPLAGLPPGEYQLQVVAFRSDTLAELGAVALGKFVQSAPARAQAVSAAPLAKFADARLELRALEFSRNAAAPGEPVRVDLLWRAAGLLPEQLGVRLALIGPGAQRAAEWRVPLGALYPAARWQPNNLVRDAHAITLPAELAAGEYQWEIAIDPALPAVAQNYRTAQLFTVLKLERQFAAPAMQTRLQAQLDGRVLLAGFTVQPGAQSAAAPLDVRLVWQCVAALPQHYRVFVHLLNAQGQLVAQSDAEPAGWTRPTTGWLPGEFVVDAHQLQLPAALAAGSYTLQAGLYDAASGQRLSGSSNPAGVVLLQAVQVAAP